MRHRDHARIVPAALSVGILVLAALMAPGSRVSPHVLFLDVQVASGAPGEAQENVSKAPGDAELGAAPVAPDETGEDEGEEILHRDDWFHEQRAFPGDSIPPNALLRAHGQALAVSRATARQRAAEPLVASNLAWTEIGPHPISQTTATIYYNGLAPWSGRVTAIAPHPSDTATAYIGTAVGGVWKTTDGGTNWTELFDAKPSLAIGALAIDPSDAGTIYAGTGEANLGTQDSIYFGTGVYVSHNAGGSWAKIGGSTFNNCYIADIAIKPTDSAIIYVAAHGVPAKTGLTNACDGDRQGVYRSTNGGDTFFKEIYGPPPTDLSVSPDAPATVYAGFYGYGVWKSTNSGADWRQLSGGTLPVGPTDGAGRVAVAAAPTNANRIYVAVAGCLSRDADCPLASADRGDLLGLWTSSNGGTNWTKLGAESYFCKLGYGQCYYDLTLAVDPANASVFYAGGIYLFRYSNAGSNHALIGWDFARGRSTIHVDFHASALSGGRLWVGSDGGMYRSNDAGASFKNLNHDLVITQFYPGTAGTVGGPYVGGTQDNGSVKYTGAPGWNEIQAGDGGYAAVSPTNTDLIYTTYPNLVIYKSTDGGQSRSRVDYGMCTKYTNANPGPQDPCEFIAPFAMDAASPSRLYAGTDRLWRTTNGGTQWYARSPHFAGNVSAIGFASGITSTLYAGTADGELQVTTNGGAATPTWNDTSGNGLPHRFITDIAVDPANPSEAYVSVSGFGTGHLFHTTNAGGTWTNVSGPTAPAKLPNAPVNAVAVDWTASTPVLYAGTDVGVFTSIDAGASWQGGRHGLPNSVVNDLLIDRGAGKVVAATYGRGAWVSPLITGV
jgi:photosystem II stability/assembly factor-like uncharacterized protein